MRRSIILFLAILALLLMIAGCKQGPQNDNISGQPKPAAGTPAAPAAQPANQTQQNATVSPVEQLIVTPKANETANATAGGNETPEAEEPQAPQIKEGMNLTVHFINVRHGDSVFIVSPNNGTMLIDGGFTNQGGPLMHYLRDNGLKEGYFDVMMASNSDPYHIGGLGAVLFNMALVGEILHNGITSDEQYYAAFDQFSKQKGKPTVVSKDRTVNLDENMQIQLIVPYVDGYFNKTEDNSIVTKITYGDVSILLMSDCTKACEDKIMGRDLKADIIKIADYGSNESTSLTLINEVKPKVAILSIGEFNEFSVPDSGLLKRLMENNIDILRTDVNGSIIVTSDGRGYSIKTEK